jgi:hypothetical protein
MTRFSSLASGLLVVALAAALLGTGIAEAKPTSGSRSSSSSRSYSVPKASPAPAAPAAPPSAPPRASGGYSAPPSSASVPSVPYSGSSSSGYRPPSSSSAAAPASVRNGSDAALNRRASAGAYTSYRATQAQFRAASAPPLRPPSNTVFAHVQPVSSYSVLITHRNTYYSSWGYVPPAYIYNYGPHFGMWDAIFLWSLASAASNAAQADWFYHHQYDQGYIDWRRQADIEAQQNADLKAQLATIDQRMATLEAQNAPRDPNYLPPGADPQVALAAENIVSHDASDADVDITRPPPAPHSSHLLLDLALAAGAIGIVVFVMRRRYA